MVNSSVRLLAASIVFGFLIIFGNPNSIKAAELPAETVFDVFVELQQALHTVDLKHFSKLVDNQAGLRLVLKDYGKKDFETTLYPFELERLNKLNRLLDTEPPVPLYTVFYGRQRIKGSELRARVEFANPGISRPILVNKEELKSNRYQTIKYLIEQKKFIVENRSRWLIFWTQETNNTASLHRWQIDSKFNLVNSSQDYVLHSINGYWYITEMVIYPGRP